MRLPSPPVWLMWISTLFGRRKHWLYLTKNFESPFKGMAGSVFKLKQACVALGYERAPGLRACKQFFP